MVVIDEKTLSRAAARDRRSVYLLIRRAFSLSLLTVFDLPLVAITCPQRDASAVPLQSLTMLNDAFLEEQAEHFAARVAAMAAGARERAVRAAFRLALARPPSSVELRLCCRLLERQATVYLAAKLPSRQAEYKALVQMCLVLFNTSEFLYVE